MSENDLRQMGFPSPETMPSGTLVCLRPDGSIRAAGPHDMSIGTTSTNGAGGIAFVRLFEEPIALVAADAFDAGEWVQTVDGGRVSVKGRETHFALQRSTGPGCRVACLPYWNPGRRTS